MSPDGKSDVPKCQSHLCDISRVDFPQEHSREQLRLRTGSLPAVLSASLAPDPAVQCPSPRGQAATRRRRAPAGVRQRAALTSLVTSPPGSSDEPVSSLRANNFCPAILPRSGPLAAYIPVLIAYFNAANRHVGGFVITYSTSGFTFLFLSFNSR